MGYAASSKVKGNFFLKTNDKKPYGENAPKNSTIVCADGSRIDPYEKPTDKKKEDDDEKSDDDGTKESDENKQNNTKADTKQQQTGNHKTNNNSSPTKSCANIQSVELRSPPIQVKDPNERNKHGMGWLG